MDIEDYFTESSEEETEKKKSVKEMADVDEDDILSMCIDQACMGCSDPEKRREYFIKAVSMIFDQLKSDG